MLKRMLRTGCTWLLGGLLSCTAVAASDEVVEDIKSVYLYNFLSFISWPEHKTTQSYQLCLAASPEFTQRVAEVVEDERVNGKSVQVMAFMPDSPNQHCDLLYIQAEYVNRVLTGQVASDVLIVTDHEHGLSYADVMIAFETRGRKVRVALHLPRLLTAGFTVSSKLLRVVRIERE